MVELSVDVPAVRIPSNIGGLGGRDGRARDHGMRIRVPTVVLAVLGDVVSSRICRREMRLLGRHHETEPYEEERPDAGSRRSSRAHT